MNMANLSETQKADQQIDLLQCEVLSELKTSQPDLGLCGRKLDEILSLQNRKYCGMMIGLASI